MATDISDSVRLEVASRANSQCEYCLISDEDVGFPHQIDHIVSRKHGGISTLDNLALSCVLCNRYKGTDIASVDSQTGAITRLFDPRHDRWPEHFRIENAMIIPISPVGRVTVSLLKLNTKERISERSQLQLLGRYATAV